MPEDPFETPRRQMIAEIVAEAALTVGHTGRAAFSERVMRVIGSMPRHEFVPVELQPYAYLNRPLPIGYEKTVLERLREWREARRAFRRRHGTDPGEVKP